MQVEVCRYLFILPSKYWITHYPLADQILKKLCGPHEKLNRPVTEIPSWFTPCPTCQTESTRTRVVIVALPRIQSSISPRLHFRHPNERDSARQANWIEQQRLQTAFSRHTFRISTRRPNILIGFRQCLQVNGGTVHIIMSRTFLSACVHICFS